jgi:hypothetical protein
MRMQQGNSQSEREGINQRTPVPRTNYTQNIYMNSRRKLKITKDPFPLCTLLSNNLLDNIRNETQRLRLSQRLKVLSTLFDRSHCAHHRRKIRSCDQKKTQANQDSESCDPLTLSKLIEKTILVQTEDQYP